MNSRAVGSEVITTRTTRARCFSLLRACATSIAASSFGFYWSSSPYYGGNNNAGYLAFYSGYVHPLNNNSRAYGFSVRCVRDKE